MWLLLEGLDPSGFLFQIWMNCNFIKMSRTCQYWYFGIRTNKVRHLKEFFLMYCKFVVYACNTFILFVFPMIILNSWKSRKNVKLISKKNCNKKICQKLIHCILNKWEDIYEYNLVFMKQHRFTKFQICLKTCNHSWSFHFIYTKHFSCFMKHTTIKIFIYLENSNKKSKLWVKNGQLWTFMTIDEKGYQWWMTLKKSFQEIKS
jgi:hypothetical protein